MKEDAKSNTPIHCTVLLYVVSTYDKFNQNFTSWSINKTNEKDSIIFVLKDVAVIDSVLLDLLLIKYPGRLKGRFIKNNTMTIEFTKNDDIDTSVDLSHVLHHNSNHNSKKRKLNNEVNLNNIDAIQNLLRMSIKKFNSSNLDIGDVSTGQDVMNKWVLFEILFVDSLNTCFVQEMKTSNILDDV